MISFRGHHTDKIMSWPFVDFDSFKFFKVFLLIRMALVEDEVFNGMNEMRNETNYSQ